jgi:hypothetical protein
MRRCRRKGLNGTARIKTLPSHGRFPTFVDRNAGRTTFPHPRFGEINLYERPVVTVLMHEPDYQAQIRELLARLRR